MKKIIIFTVILAMTASIFASIPASAEDTNLVKGLEYTVTLDAQTSYTYPNLVLKDPKFALTDGKKGGNSMSDSAYLRFYRGAYTTVEFDLGSIKYVDGFKAGFFAGTGAGIYLPREMYLSVSEDGEKWYTAYSYRDDTVIADKNQRRVQISETLDGYYKAKYVRFRFSSDVYVFADEVEILGVDSGADAKEHGYDNVEYPEAFKSYKNELLNDTRNLVLLYNGKYYNGAESAIGSYSESEILPYVAYLDSKGNAVDTMFDSFLFIPLAPGSDDFGFQKQVGWEAYLENTIGLSGSSRINMAALDDAVASAIEKLGLSDDFKVNVFISVPYPSHSSVAFGKLGGDRSVSPNSLESKNAIIEWYIDKALDMYEKAGFTHLRFTGFYWYSELINFSDSKYEVDFVKHFNDYVHSKGYGTSWIPYYCTPGVALWEEMGFDIACLQSGYAFPKAADSETGDSQLGACNAAMSYAKKHGMGVEMEISGSAAERYDDYIRTAATLGCMKDGVAMYYIEGKPGCLYKQALAGNRTPYDLTYLYVSDKYEKEPPVIEFDGMLIIEKNSSNTNGKITITDADTKKTQLKIDSVERTTHGKVSIDRDGFVVYTPEKDYVGEDSFTFTVTDGVNVSEPCTVDILVVEKVFRYGSANASLGENRAVLYDKVESTGTKSSEGSKVFEVSVDNDMNIISALYTENSKIPENGCVISASGSKAEELEQSIVNMNKIILDTTTKSVYFISDTEEENSDPSSDVPSEPVNEKEGGSKVWLFVALGAAVALIAAAVGVTKIIKNKNQKGEK